MPVLIIVDRNPAELRPNPRSARTHSPDQIRLLSEAILKFGFVSPVQIDGADMILVGHARVAAAKILGLREIPTVRLDHLTEAERRAYTISDNRLAEIAGWDKGLLALEFKELEEFDFDLDLTGFDLGERSIIIDVDGDTAAEDECPEPSAEAPVSQLGDLWQLGEHRLLCGSALEKSAYGRLLGAERVVMAFADVPYNVPIQGHVSGLGRNKHREFAMASGEMTEAEFTAFLNTAFGHMAAFSRDGSIHLLCIDWRHLQEMFAAAKGVFTELKNLAVWVKSNGGMGSLYRSRHELVLVYKNGSAPHINNVQLGRNARNRTNVWEYPGANTFHRDRDQELAAHPTPKPLALVADAIKDVSRRGDHVLDPFGGSGTTLIAAEKTGRKARLIELDPIYVDVTVRRWQALTGGVARLESTGQSFDELKAAGRPASAEVIAFPGKPDSRPPRAAPKRRRKAPQPDTQDNGGSNEHAA